MGDLPYNAQHFLSLLRGRKYNEINEVIEKCFGLFEERQMSKQTVSYVTMDILVNFTSYLTELGVDISENMSEEMAELNQLAYTVSAGEVKERILKIIENEAGLL